MTWEHNQLESSLVHETSCPEWSHGKKVSQHSGCSLHCPMLTVDWNGVGKKMHWAPWKTLQDHLFKLSLTQIGWSSVYWMQLSFWRIGNYGEAYQHHRCWSASRPAQPPPPPFPLTSSAPGSLARNIEEGISVAPRTSVPCRRLENTTFYVKKRKRQQYLGT